MLNQALLLFSRSRISRLFDRTGRCRLDPTVLYLLVSGRRRLLLCQLLHCLHLLGDLLCKLFSGRCSIISGWLLLGAEGARGVLLRTRMRGRQEAATTQTHHLISFLLLLLLLLLMMLDIRSEIGRGELPVLFVVAEARRAAAVRATVLLRTLMMNAQLLGA